MIVLILLQELNNVRISPCTIPHIHLFDKKGLFGKGKNL